MFILSSGVQGSLGGGLFDGWTIPLECSPMKEGGGSGFLLTHLVCLQVSLQLDNHSWVIPRAAGFTTAGSGLLGCRVSSSFLHPWLGPLPLTSFLQPSSQAGNLRSRGSMYLCSLTPALQVPDLHRPLSS